VKCQSDSGDVAEASFSKAPASFVEDDGEPTGNAEIGGHIKPRRVPFAAFLDQQRRAAVAAGSVQLCRNSSRPPASVARPTIRHSVSAIRTSG